MGSMTISQPDSSEALNAVREVLGEVLPSQRVIDVPLDSETPPLLVLRTSQVLAGFGVSVNGSEPNGSYRVLYEGFKEKYYERQEDWDDLDPVFVFCISPNAPRLEQFGTKVETDVYFCRKFVVPLRSPLKKVFSQLPFLPLGSATGPSLRPRAAKTILQLSGMSAHLAEHLVVQGRRSPETIVQACIAGSHGEPTPLAELDSALIPIEGSTEVRTIARTISIKSFRAYRTEQTFALGEKITVLYGPNGFGKTSFFDAIDFAVTGEIGRLAARSGTTFKKIATHLDSSPADSRVCLTFSKQNIEHEIVRVTSNPMRALLDQAEVGRKAILSFLTNGTVDHIENFVRLFRSTHLFSQEHPELARGFEQDCTLATEVVSRLLSFEDYSSALSKIREIQRILDREIQGQSNRIEGLQIQINKARSELDSLGSVAVHKQPSLELNQLIGQLSRKISAAGVEGASDKPDAVALASWRAILTARIETIKGKISRWSNLLGDASELPNQQSILSQFRKSISEQKELLLQLDNQYQSLSNRRERVREEVATLERRRTRLEVKIKDLSWLRERIPLHSDLLTRKQGALRLFAEFSRTAVELNESREYALQRLRRNEAEYQKLSAELGDRRHRLISVQRLIDDCDEWISQRKRLSEITEQIRSESEGLDQVRTGVQTAKEQRDHLSQREEALRLRVQVAQDAQSELEGLVSQVRRHLKTGICPVCGQDHGSFDALLHRVDSRDTPDSTRSDRVQLEKIRSESKTASDNLASFEARQVNLERRLSTLRSTRRELLAKVEAFDQKAKDLGVNSSGALVRKELIEIADALMNEIAGMEQQETEKKKEGRSLKGFHGRGAASREFET